MNNSKKKKGNATNIVVMVIGALCIAAAVYGLLNGKSFFTFFINLFIGISLLGVGYIEYKKIANCKENGTTHR